MEPSNEHLDKVLKLILEENNLRLKNISEGRNSMMKAISDALYFTTVYHKDIQSMCVFYMKNELPCLAESEKLAEFRNNSYLFKDYCENPQMTSFQHTNMEVVSRVFGICIKVYSISIQDVNLSCYSVNNRFTRVIRLLKRSDDHFDTLYSTKKYELFGYCQNLVFNILGRALHNDKKWKNVNKNRYINIEYENHRKKRGVPSRIRKRDRIRKALSANPNPIEQNYRMTPTKLANNGKPFATQVKEPKERNFHMFTAIKPKNNDMLRIISGKKDQESKQLEPSLLAMIEKSYNKILSDEMASESVGSESLELISTKMMESSQSLPRSTPKRAPAPASDLKPRYEFNHSQINIFAKEVNLTDIQQEDNTPIKIGAPDLQKVLFSTPRYQFSNGLASPNKQQTQKYKEMVMSRNNSTSENKNKAGFFGFQSSNNKVKDEPLLMQHLIGGAGIHPPQTPQQIISFGQSYPAPPIPQVKRKPIILDEGKKRHTGRLKFFDENKNFGFIIMDEDGSDIFVHYDDLSKANLPKELLRTAKKGNTIKLSFTCLSYIGKHNRSKKAVDLELLPPT